MEPQSPGRSDPSPEEETPSPKSVSQPEEPASPAVENATANEEAGASELSEYESPKGRFIRCRELIGKGAFKTVYRALDKKTGGWVAWTEVPVRYAKRDKIERLKKEVTLLKTLEHTRFLKFHLSWYEKSTGRVCFITDLATGGSLRSFVEKYSITMYQIKKYSRQILEALAYLHSHKIVHRDLKCDNIFVSDDGKDIKIGDFGLAKDYVVQTSLKTIAGTPEFMAPELFSGTYLSSVDIYAFGMCVLEMMTKTIPYQEISSVGQLVRLICRQPQALPQSLSLLEPDFQEAADFIRRCIVPKEDFRAEEGGSPVPEEAEKDTEQSGDPTTDGKDDTDAETRLVVATMKKYVFTRPTAEELLADPFLELKEEDKLVYVNPAGKQVVGQSLTAQKLFADAGTSSPTGQTCGASFKEEEGGAGPGVPIPPDTPTSHDNGWETREIKVEQPSPSKLEREESPEKSLPPPQQPQEEPKEEQQVPLDRSEESPSPTPDREATQTSEEQTEPMLSGDQPLEQDSRPYEEPLARDMSDVSDPNVGGPSSYGVDPTIPVVHNIQQEILPVDQQADPGLLQDMGQFPPGSMPQVYDHDADVNLPPGYQRARDTSSGFTGGEEHFPVQHFPPVAGGQGVFVPVNEGVPPSTTADGHVPGMLQQYPDGWGSQSAMAGKEQQGPSPGDTTSNQGSQPMGNIPVQPGYDRDQQGVPDAMSVVSNSAMSDAPGSLPMPGFVNDSGVFIPTVPTSQGMIPEVPPTMGGIAMPHTQGAWVDQEGQEQFAMDPMMRMMAEVLQSVSRLNQRMDHLESMVGTVMVMIDEQRQRGQTPVPSEADSYFQAQHMFHNQQEGQTSHEYAQPSINTLPPYPGPEAHHHNRERSSSATATATTTPSSSPEGQYSHLAMSTSSALPVAHAKPSPSTHPRSTFKRTGSDPRHALGPRNGNVRRPRPLRNGATAEARHNRRRDGDHKDGFPSSGPQSLHECGESGRQRGSHGSRRSSVGIHDAESAKMKTLRTLDRRIQECTKKYRSHMQHLKDQIQEEFRRKERGRKRLEMVVMEMQTLSTEKPANGADGQPKPSVRNRSEGLITQLAQRGKELNEQRLKKERERREQKYEQILKSYNSQVDKLRNKGFQATSKFQDEMQRCWEEKRMLLHEEMTQRDLDKSEVEFNEAQKRTCDVANASLERAGEELDDDGGRSLGTEGRPTGTGNLARGVEECLPGHAIAPSAPSNGAPHGGSGGSGVLADSKGPSERRLAHGDLAAGSGAASDEAQRDGSLGGVVPGVGADAAAASAGAVEAPAAHAGHGTDARTANGYVDPTSVRTEAPPEVHVTSPP